MYALQFTYAMQYVSRQIQISVLWASFLVSNRCWVDVYPTSAQRSLFMGRLLGEIIYFKWECSPADKERDIDGLVQDCSISSALDLALLH